MRMLAGNWNSVSCEQLRCKDANTHVLDIYGDCEELDPPHKNDEWVTVIPLKDIQICKTAEDMSQCGFEKIGECLWKNNDYKVDARGDEE